MSGDGLLDFDRRNILAAADDDVFLAIDDVDVILLVPDRHVTGMKPAVGENRFRSLGLVVVAVHDVVAAGYNFSNGLTVTRYVPHLRVDHADFGAQQWPARCGKMVEPVGFVGACDRAFGLSRGDHGTGLGETVARAYLAVEGLLQAGDQFGG